MTPLQTPPHNEVAPLAAARDRLIVALDFPTENQALALVVKLEGTCTWFKVGLELYLAAGNSILEKLRAQGHSVFLDLKLHDIPNTVAAAVRTVSSVGASLLTVHSFGGPAMLSAAAEAAASIPGAPQLLAVTVLTSMDDAQLKAIGVPSSAAVQALRLSQVAKAAGIHGLVCSAQELRLLRGELGSQALLVTPGIRPAGAATNDQKRIATPASAIAAGASMLVVGRPITQAADPAAAASSILAEIESAQQR
ncbi:MAG: orotidine-5'-phosphate decarboxylase [Acidobacteriaceae bacterium]